jgi:DNA-binding CsgD family transcriptional regulator
VLLGRRSELQALGRLIEAVLGGESRALVLRGEAGVGKTVLLDQLVVRATGCRVMRATGVQSEMELAFAAVHQLCAPILGLRDRLPGPQRAALDTAFGLSADGVSEPFLVGLAVLGLLAEAARDRPIIWVVDDAQWLDRASAQTLAFVARRVVAESVALVFSVRADDPAADFWDLPRLDIRGLPEQDARQLLGSALRGPVDRQVLDRIIAESRGNPLALLELPRGLTAADLAGGFRSAERKPLPGRIEDVIRRQLQPLPPDTFQLLVIAAAEPVGDPVSLWRAAATLGIGADAATPATAAGLLEIGARVWFEHPLVRSVVYRAATPEQLQAAHRTLAEVTDPAADPDRHAWHVALGTSGRDDGVADDLERAAEGAQARGGLAAAAAFLERASTLTVDPAHRAARALAAAQATFQAGSPDDALRLVSLAEAGPLDKLQQAQAELLRAQIAFAENRGGNAVRLLLQAAMQLEPLDPAMARDTYLDALCAAVFAGPLAADGDVRAVAEAARSGPAAQQPSRPSDLLLDGLATRFLDGYGPAMATLRQALRAFDSPELSREQGMRWLWRAHATAVDIWADENWEALANRHVQLAREAGALTALPLALSMGIGAHMLTGDLAAAAALTDELQEVTEATGSRVAPYGPLLLAAWQGREAEAAELIATARDEGQRRGEGTAVIFADWMQALLYNSIGRYGQALLAARRATDHPQEMGAPTWGALIELAEAATRTGHPAEAAAALERLTPATRASGSDWALGLESRSRALLGHDDQAEPLYRDAVERLSRTPIRGEYARAHLLYGEWLRRRQRNLDARSHLHTSYDMFTAMGMTAFANRAGRELHATGEAVRRRGPETTTELTGQEAHIARLVRQGLTNVEIASRLFISPRTVEWHLSKIFAKLQITSRRQLTR